MDLIRILRSLDENVAQAGAVRGVHRRHLRADVGAVTGRSLADRCTVIVLATAALAACATPPRLHPLVATQIQDWDQTSLASPVYCGSLVKIEYDTTKIADASPVYFNNDTGAVVARCDNPMVRMPESERVTCPPPAWTCSR